MPNHVINILSFEGDKTKIRQMLEDIKDDEYGLHSVDFNKIIPMPPSLDLEASSRTQAGLAAYKDFIDVYTLGGTINTDICRIFRLQASSAFSKCGQTSIMRISRLASRRGITCGCTAKPPGTAGAMRIGVPNGTHTGMTDTNLPPCRMIASGFRPHGRNPSPS